MWDCDTQPQENRVKQKEMGGGGGGAETDSKHTVSFSTCACVGQTNLFGTSLKHHILLALVQPPLSHRPKVQDTILPLQQLVQDV